ncbi:uncharacterized YkwD family protein [Bacillus oleivorans]|uniref:Uncharacterized YkwD family protein n=1 Tax=Bacillus oleivorans TaxID=1448271 RepID=A0A285CMR4_9BACI|nr:CAP domain-containing protein [Bacillus oleivorans]SNX68358.1 uncharacterized YkwD family protein [Bacillus oleivorans]
MKKSWIISAAAAATLIFSGAATTTADAAEVNVQSKVYTYQFNNMNQANSYIQNLLSQYGIQWNQVKWNVPTTQAPTQAQPKAQTPAPAQQPAAEQPAKQTTTNTAASVSQFEKQVVELTNQERAKAGLAPLQLDENLSKVAKAKSQDMQQKGYFDHNSPTYGSPFDMMRSFGIQYKSAGENIAMGQRSPEEVVQAWMNSAGHRANILNSSFTHIGVGYVANGNYWTQMFIGK